MNVCKGIAGNRKRIVYNMSMFTEKTMDISATQHLINKQVDAIVTEIASNIKNDDFCYKGFFNTKDLPDHKGYTVFVNNHPFRNQFKFYDFLDLKKEQHCLYWFELDSIEKASEIFELMQIYRKRKGTEDYKTIPATNSYRGYGKSKILYVGVRRAGYRKSDDLTNITGRINQHLGYYDNPRTQGLQLYEYARGKDFNITLKVIAFEGIEPYLLNVIEKKVARILKPLCGRH